MNANVRLSDYEKWVVPPKNSDGLPLVLRRPGEPFMADVISIEGPREDLVSLVRSLASALGLELERDNTGRG